MTVHPSTAEVLTPSRDGDGLPQWLGIAEFAGYIGVPKQTVYRWRTEGKGPKAHKLGSHVRFSRENVLAWLAEQEES